MDKMTWSVLALIPLDMAGFIPAWLALSACLAGLLVFSLAWTRAGGR